MLGFGLAFTRRGRPLLVTAIVLLVVLSASPSIGTASTSPSTQPAGSSFGASQPIGIDACQDIEKSGSYVLSANITAVNRSNPNGTIACIDIKAEDVVLNGKGHTIDGKPLQRFENIKSNSSEENLSNSYGIKIGDTRNVTVRNVTTVDFVQGVGVFDSSNVTVEYLVDKRSIAYGIYLGYNAHDNVVRYNRLRNSTDKGIAIYEYSDNVTVYGNTIVNNSNLGIALDEVDGTLIYNNTIVGNGAGIIVSHSNRTVIENNIIQYEDRFWSGGLTIRDSTGNIVRNNEIRGDLSGMELWNVTDTLVKENMIRDQENLLLRENSRSNRLVDNRIVGGENGLITGEQATRNLVRGLNITGTSEQAILLNGGGNQSLSEVTVRETRGGIEIKSTHIRLSAAAIHEAERYGIRVDGGQNVTIAGVTIEMSEGTQIEAVAGARAVSISNYSIGSTRVSITANEFTLHTVADTPDTPEGTSIASSPIELSVPEGHEVTVRMRIEDAVGAEGEVGLWGFEGGWSRLRTVDGTAQNWTVSARVEGQMLLVLLVAEQSSSTQPPPDPTATPTYGASAAQPTTGETQPTPTAVATPGQTGFGLVVGLVSVVILTLVAKRWR